jgi:Winged helix DNA-binding domain
MPRLEMTNITSARLANQRLSGTGFARPEDVVSWLGAVQAQDYPGAKWALALRMNRASESMIDSAFAAGTILRTHVLRPTWHFVAPADIRWMLALSKSRISAMMAPYNRRLELDATVFRRSRRAIARALRGGVPLTRPELKVVLQRAGINPGSIQRLAHIVIQAELDGVICSGPARGNQSTYTLFEERVPASRPLTRDHALAELARRYFTSHGPAQLRDFAWWAGLTLGDARAGVAMAERDLVQDTVDSGTYWLSSATQPRSRSRAAYLLPIYDEYLIAYKDRSAALDTSSWSRVVAGNPFSAPVVVDGQVVGAWKQALGKGAMVIRIRPFTSIAKRDAVAIEGAVRSYGDFLGRDPELAWQS